MQFVKGRGFNSHSVQLFVHLFALVVFILGAHDWRLRKRGGLFLVMAAGRLCVGKSLSLERKPGIYYRYKQAFGQN
jgi:hypothetical protein